MADQEHQVLAGLQTKSVLLPATVQEIEEGLRDRDTSSMNGAMSPQTSDVLNAPGAPNRDETSVNGNVRTNNVLVKLDKRQVEQRIEEDRERHKRLREEIWAVGGEDNPDEEFDRMWDEVSSLGSDDFLQAEEEAAERNLALEVS